MKPLVAKDIKGNWATLILSWQEDDSLDIRLTEQQIDLLIKYRVDGIYSNGTAGELHCQTEDDFVQVSELLSSKCNAAGMPFQIGVGHMSPQISLERLKRAVRLFPSAVQVILPDWFPTTERENISFLKRMAEEARGIGLVLYNPPHAKRVLTPKSIASLTSVVPQLVGLKTAGGDDEWYDQMRIHLSELSVFVPGHHLATGFQRGAAGAYSNVACLNPVAAQRWTDLMNTDMLAALELEARIRDFMDSHIAPFILRDEYCNAACDRLLTLIGGWTEVGANMRWPYQSIPVEEANRLRPIARNQLPEFFPNAGEC